MVGNAGWKVPVEPGQELERLLKAAIELAKTGLQCEIDFNLPQIEWVLGGAVTSLGGPRFIVLRAALVAKVRHQNEYLVLIQVVSYLTCQSPSSIPNFQEEI